MIRWTKILLIFFVVATVQAGETTKTQRVTLQIPRVSQPRQLEDYLQGMDGQDGHDGRDGRSPNHKKSHHHKKIEAKITDFRQYEPGDGIAVSQETHTYLSYDDKNLFVVFVCQDDPGKVRGRLAKREDIASDDQVVVYLDTFHDGQRAYMFAANPLGIQLDGIITEGQDEDYSFDTLWQSEGRLTPEGLWSE